MEKTETAIEDVSYFVFHQANRLINESIRKKLKLPEEKVPYSLGKYGNTSSASIPITILSELRDKVTQGKNTVLLSGFGVGLSWVPLTVMMFSNIDPKYIPEGTAVLHLLRNIGSSIYISLTVTIVIRSANKANKAAIAVAPAAMDK